MEFEFGKHFKDATNLLLMMDHDSGYVEGVENYPINLEANGLKSNVYMMHNEPNSFFLNEDALLEKPDICENARSCSKHDYENNQEDRESFFSPGYVVNSSVVSQNSTVVYSGLESEANSEKSIEIPVQTPIIVESKEVDKDTPDDFNMNNSSLDKDVTAVTDMSFNQEIMNVSNNSSITSSFKGFCLESKENIIQTNNDTGTLQSIDKCKNVHIPLSNNGVSLGTPRPPTEGSSQMTTEKSTDHVNAGDEKALTNITREKRRLTLVFSKANKENEYNVKRKYPSMTPEKNYENKINPNVSPDMFDDEEISAKTSYFETNLSVPQGITQTKTEERYVDKLDYKLLKRTQKGMSGVLPPPSITIVNMSVSDMLNKLTANKEYFWNSNSSVEQTNNEDKDSSLDTSNEDNVFSNSLLINIKSAEEICNSDWPCVLNLRFHGLHHNRSKISEDIESLCEKYQKRFVGAETQSTCTVFESKMSSPSKRKMIKQRWGTKSPGRRLSHLARRRITFSSANLQAGGLNLAGSRARQILVDAKKMELLNRRKSPLKSPKKTPKKTPGKSPKIKTRTPSSSAKKKLAIRFRKLTGEFQRTTPGTSELASAHKTLFKNAEKDVKSENSQGSSFSTKRALFQSPDRDKSASLSIGNSLRSCPSDEKTKLRRALFTSPRKLSPLKTRKSPFKHALRYGFEKKRKRSESDDMPPSKFSRSMSMSVSSTAPETSKCFIRAQSDLNISSTKSQFQQDLTDTHKKKLQWAVYGALQMQNITKDHPQWKIFAAVLGRVTRYFFTGQLAASAAAGARLEGGTTERMNRIARLHVFSVIKGKTADEIVKEYLRSKPKVQKPQGYVAPEEFNNIKAKVTSGGKENVFHDRANTIESWEKKRLQQLSKPTNENRIERIRKVINFGDDR